MWSIWGLYIFRKYFISLTLKWSVCIVCSHITFRSGCITSWILGIFKLNTNFTHILACNSKCSCQIYDVSWYMVSCSLILYDCVLNSSSNFQIFWELFNVTFIFGMNGISMENVSKWVQTGLDVIQWFLRDKQQLFHYMAAFFCKSRKF